MIVITTPTGQIGRQVLGNLLDSGEQLRVIARDPSKLPAGVRKDLDIVEGSHGGFVIDVSVSLEGNADRAVGVPGGCGPITHHK